MRGSSFKLFDGAVLSSSSALRFSTFFRFCSEGNGLLKVETVSGPSTSRTQTPTFQSESPLGLLSRHVLDRNLCHRFGRRAWRRLRRRRRATPVVCCGQAQGAERHVRRVHPRPIPSWAAGLRMQPLRSWQVRARRQCPVPALPAGQIRAWVWVCEVRHVSRWFLRSSRGPEPVRDVPSRQVRPRGVAVRVQGVPSRAVRHAQRQAGQPLAVQSMSRGAELGRAGCGGRAIVPVVPARPAIARRPGRYRLQGLRGWKVQACQEFGRLQAVPDGTFVPAGRRWCAPVLRVPPRPRGNGARDRNMCRVPKRPLRSSSQLPLYSVSARAKHDGQSGSCAMRAVRGGAICRRYCRELGVGMLSVPNGAVLVWLWRADARSMQGVRARAVFGGSNGCSEVPQLRRWQVHRSGGFDVLQPLSFGAEQ